MPKKYLYEKIDEQNYSSGSVTDKLTFLLVGSGIGAALALLFAPKSGRELRTDIADATRKSYDKTRETAQQLKRQTSNDNQSTLTDVHVTEASGKQNSNNAVDISS